MSKALCVATKCTTREQFIESFYRFCDEQTFFVATLNQRPIGLETPFSINLADRTPVLRGLCVVLDAWSTPANPYGRPGIRLGIKRLTAESEDMFAKLAQRRACQGATSLEQRAETTTVTDPAPPAPPATPPPIPVQPVQAVVDPPTTPVAMPLKPVAPVVPSVIAQLEQRTPGSDIVLPANPLMNLTDESLVGFVDCTLYEETGNFFRAPDADAVGADALLLSDADLAEPPPPPDFTPTVPQRPTPPPAAAAPPPRPSATPPPMPAVAPPPAAAVPTEPAVQTMAPIEPMQPIARGRHNRTLMMAGGAAALAALIVFIAVGSSSDASTDGTKKPEPAATTPAPKPATTASTATPKDPRPATATDDATNDPTNDAPPDELDPPPAANPDGAPLVGTGPCRLDITTTPAGTKVVVDGKEIGPSPISIAGPCEKHKVDLIHPRYKQATQFVALSEGAPKKLDVTLIRPTHQLVIKTTPPGATISIQGRRAGTSPTTVALMGFSGIDVTIARPGYETVTKRVYSKTPTETLTVQLKRYKW